MDPVWAIIAALVLLGAALAIGVPIGVTLGLSGLLGMYLMLGPTAALAQLRSAPFHLTSEYAFAVIPLFILMGQLAFVSGITGELYDMAYRWLGRLRGGLVMATLAAAALFGAVSGSAVASAALFTRMALPEMLERGYSRTLAAGSIAAAGTLAVVIPPSIMIVIYGMITQESVARLLVAGIIPGFFVAIVFGAITYVMVRVRPDLCPLSEVRSTWKQRLASLRGLWAVVVIFLLVMGGIYTGMFTPTAAGAVGAFGVLAVAILRRRLSSTGLHGALQETAVVTSVVFTIIIGGYFFGRFLALSGVVAGFSEFVVALPVSPMVVMLGLIAMYFVLGMFLETISLFVLTLPMVHPAVLALGFDPIWFGIIVVLMANIGTMTPPVGLIVYVVSGASGGRVNAKDAFVGATPFVIASFIAIGFLSAFPGLIVWLPRMMMGR